MDNAEILKAMGFEFVTGEMWRHEAFGIIHVGKDDELTLITEQIFYLGVNSHKEQLRKFIGIK